MNSERIKSVFADALDLPSDERDGFLASLATSEPSIIARVRALLAAHDSAESFLVETSTHLPRPAPVTQRPPLQPGTVIGPYTITRRLGEGGFAVVYEAQQTTPVRRDVALKLLRPDVVNHQVIQRFAYEQQTLAMMDHPGIARVYDAGTTDDGQPYFVMELVDGLPITTYCDTHRLSIRDRLKLFTDVCHAVHHAHQKGIIHRDIKPSNVLVRTVDDRPEARVIDFGIAKALDHASVNQPAVTQERQIVGTPQYMSPEQAALAHDDIDTRTDVYSLGVLLYELLSGTTPLSETKSLRMPMNDLLQRVRDVEPTKPSLRVTTDRTVAITIARARRQDPLRLSRELRGDLDWIVLRALEKVPDRRYPSAYALAEDIRRHGRNEAVDAGPPSATYRLTRFARRHRVELAALAVLILSLVALGAGGIVFGYRERAATRRVETELAKSQALAAFAQSIFAGINPAAARGADTTLLRTILDGATQRVDAELADQPGAAVPMLNMIGTTYTQLGEYALAEPIFRHAMAIGTNELGVNNGQTLDARSNLAVALGQQSRYTDAIEIILPVVEYKRRTFGTDSVELFDTESNLGVLYFNAGEYDKAESLQRDLLRRRRQHFGDDHRDTLATMNNLAMVYTNVRRMDEAIEMLELVLAAQLRLDGEKNPRTLATMSNLATSYSDVGRFDEAESMLRRALGVKRDILPPGHSSIFISQANLASVLIKREQLNEAEAILREALEACRKSQGSMHLHTAGLLNQLGVTLREMGRPAEARACLTEAADIMRTVAGPDHPNTIAIITNQLDVAERSGDSETVRTDAAQLLVHARQRFNDGDRPIVTILRIDARAAIDLQQFEDARANLDAAHAAVQANEGDNQQLLAEIAEVYAELHDALGETERADQWRLRMTGPDSSD
jgi:non-specific serine/threonine protein kinase/serine/threonine-protein kinase